MRYLITFSYDGNNFDGYQRQNDKKTIQGTIEKVLTKLNNNEIVCINSSGRTDKGVHAINQTAHFDLNLKITLYGLKKYLNKSLKEEIYVKKVEIVKPDFHARYMVKEKTYKYLINIGEYNIFSRNYIYQYNKDLNIEKMKEAISYLKKEHDFRSFCKEEKDRLNCIRTIYKADIKTTDKIVEITITGNGFLRKMVRNIVGVLIEIGSLKKEPIYIKELLDSKGKVHNMKTVPGCGLYLKDVKY